MKNLKIIFTLSLLVFMYACSPTDEEIDNSPTTIYDRIEASPNYSILNYALQKLDSQEFLMERMCIHYLPLLIW